MNTIQVEINLVAISCGACGLPFGLPDYYLKKLQETGKSFNCPNGCSIGYNNNEVDRLKKELAKVEKTKTIYKQWFDDEVDRRKSVERSLSATKGVLTKAKKRIANGVCPCCHRHFTNVERHMNSKHPDYAKEVAQ